jgi:response regulator RpfG family c-di-GMP phosphodiesterase
MSEFRNFLADEGDSCDADYQPHWPLNSGDPYALIAAVCTDIDARQARTRGRGDRLERIVRSIVARLREPRFDADRAVFAGRLTALARTGQDGSADDVFTLSRLGIESRAGRAATSAQILATAPSFAAFVPIVGAIEEWYNGAGLPARLAGEEIDPLARVLAVAIAAEALSAETLTAGDARRRIKAAAGTRLDPGMVEAYLATGAVG